MCILEFVMMVAAVSGAASTTAPQNPKTTASHHEHGRRPPLLPSEKDNSNGISNNPKKPKSRIVSSRYMSPSTSTSTSNSSSLSSSSSSSRRFPSPVVSRNSTPLPNAPSLTSKRSVSVDRRRQGVSRPLTPDFDPKNGNVSAATKLLVTSTRSLSVSFQGEAFSLPISKTKVAPPSPNLTSVRKGTPERRRSSTPSRGKADIVDSCKLADQHRWPARHRLMNPLSRSLECSGNVEDRSSLSGSVSAVRSLQHSMIDERRPSLDGRACLDLGHPELPNVVQRSPYGNSVNNEVLMPCDLTTSDSDSVSSGSTSGIQECGRASQRQNGPRGIFASAKFWQETNSRLRRLQDPGSPLSTSPGSKLIVPPKLKKYSGNGSILSSPRTMSSPIRGGVRAASPSKLMTPVGSSPSRGHSPSRIRNAVSTINNNFTDTPSVLSFAVDVQRGKVGESKILDAHFLRLLYNRHLQWRFVNARTEAVLLVQKRSAEKNLWNAWITSSDLRDTVAKRRHRLQLLRQKLKLASILKKQMTFLEDWASLDENHLISVVGAIEALKASTLRLPVVGGATGDVQSLQKAIGSAVEVMQAMASSVYLLLPTVEEVSSLVSELAKVTKKERALLEQCTDYISLLEAMQVKESNLRTHLVQCNRVRRACPKTGRSDCI
ncbi:QWRF motif-containing protein 2 [Salvia miltiorrhiza]|uniref:QWRF motif-containing protein 2 n=1 Tax=Salvia miltiorrhiza TaxID=226208 RepID=UPI0025AC09B6|nr:QWRF motif-containing protein 2 [Salvia miltiorrhiza]XP_057788158.1 QWRF motif-containing protein 2 [Salvia miltiorrhiza]